MMRSDSHIHLFERGYHGTRERDGELTDYLEFRETYEIARALVVGYEGETRFRGNNDYVLSLAQQHDWIIPLVFLDPAAPLTAKQASALLADGAAGFSLYLGQNASLADAFAPEFWEVVRKRNAILSLNATPTALAGGAEFIRSLRGVNTLVSHIGLPGPVKSGARGQLAPLLALADCDEVSVKLSGLYAIDPVYPHPGAHDAVFEILDAFGANRMPWGSDFSPGLDVLPAGDLFAIPDWLSSALSTGELAQVMHGSLQRVEKGD